MGGERVPRVGGGFVDCSHCGESRGDVSFLGPRNPNLGSESLHPDLLVPTSAFNCVYISPAS